jgi:hypothetical protein
MENTIYNEDGLLAVKSEENKTTTITNTLGWEIYTFENEEWELLETKEGNLTEVLTYMYELEIENLGIKINNQINKFK